LDNEMRKQRTESVEWVDSFSLQQKVNSSIMERLLNDDKIKLRLLVPHLLQTIFMSNRPNLVVLLICVRFLLVWMLSVKTFPFTNIMNANALYSLSWFL